MNKLRLLSVLVVLAITLVAAGCGGGSARSVEIDKDVVGITSTLNNFIAAARSGDQAVLQSLLASPGEYSLIVEDFGVDINNPNDNATYTFYVNPDLISQPSVDSAHVYAYYIQYSGDPLWLYFKMAREDGRWIIEKMLNEAPKSGGYVQPVEPVIPTPIPPTPIPPTPIPPEPTPPPAPPAPPEPPSSFVTALFNPFSSDITKIYSIEDEAGNASTTRLVTHFSTEFTEGDITYYQLYETLEEPDGAGYEGFVPVAAASARNLIGNIGDSIKRNLRDSRFSLRAQAETEVYVYYGIDSAGALWLKMADSSGMMVFNNGEPLKLFEPSHAYGETRVIPYSITYDGIYTDNWTMTIQIGELDYSFVTPLQTYPVVPVTYTDVYDETGDGAKWIEYLASEIGEVGYDNFDTLTSTTASETNRLLIRYNSSRTINDRNDPYITNYPTHLGAFYDGQAIPSIQMTSSGGLAPFLYRWYYTSGPFPGLTLTRDGLLSGSIADNPALGEGYQLVIEVVDKYNRHSHKTFTLDIVSNTGPVGVVSFAQPLPAIVPYKFAAEEYILVEGASVAYAAYTWEVLEPSSVETETYVTVYEDPESGLARISIYGYAPGAVMSFRIRANHLASGAQAESTLQTVSVENIAVNRR